MNNVPSGDVKYFEGNRLRLDTVFNVNKSTYTDRFGGLRKTWFGVEADFKNMLSLQNTTFTATINDFKTQFANEVRGFGRSELGDWKVGLVVTSINQIVRYSGNWYRYNGAFPHTIYKETPALDGNWLNLGTLQDALLLQNNLSDLQDKAKARSNLGLQGLKINEQNGTLTFAGSNVAIENRANNFTGGSQVSSTNGVNFVAKASSQGVSAYYSVRDADNTNIGYVGKGGIAYDFTVVNQKTGKSLILRENGLLHYANNEVLTIGNAGAFNGIGSNFVRVSKATSGRGQTVSGSTLEALLSGSWIAMNYSSFTVGSETFYAQLFTRVS